MMMMDRLLRTPAALSVLLLPSCPLEGSLVIVFILFAALVVILIIDLGLGLVRFLLVVLLFLLGGCLLGSALALVVGSNGLVVLGLELVGLGYIGSLVLESNSHGYI
jgi:hypothetical protein